MTKSWREIVLALTGIVLATRQVDRLAKTGYLDSAQFELCIAALLNQDPKSTDVLFFDNSLAQIDWPAQFEYLENLIVDYRNTDHLDVFKYSLGAIHLQKKLMQNKKMLNTVGVKLEKANAQAGIFTQTHDNVIANIADIYTDTISTMPYRIQVNGEYGYLQQQRVASQIRALLFCAIRFATLWRQSGGKKWHFMLYKRDMTEAAHNLVLEAKQRIIH